VVGLNLFVESQLGLDNKTPTVDVDVDINKTIPKNPVMIPFHLKRSNNITQMNDNIIIASTISWYNTNDTCVCLSKDRSGNMS
jgi:hypothetical protein